MKQLKKDEVFRDAPGETGMMWRNLAAMENTMGEKLLSYPIGTLAILGQDGWLLDDSGEELIVCHANMMHGFPTEISSRFDFDLGWVDIEATEISNYIDSLVAAMDDAFFLEPEQLKELQRNSASLTTEDGYVFNAQSDGSWSDGDMEYTSFEEMHSEHEGKLKPAFLTYRQFSDQVKGLLQDKPAGTSLLICGANFVLEDDGNISATEVGNEYPEAADQCNESGWDNGAFKGGNPLLYLAAFSKPVIGTVQEQRESPKTK